MDAFNAVNRVQLELPLPVSVYEITRRYDHTTIADVYQDDTAHLVAEGTSGRMVALQGGTYTHIPISTIMQDKKRVDVDELYDINEYRPKVRHVLGKPMFLY